MALYLTEADVRQLFSVEDAIEVVESALVAQASGRAANQPRRRVQVPGGTLHYMAGMDLTRDALGIKSYTAFRGGAAFLVLHYSASTGRLLALIEANWLGAARTGAASGVATRHMARTDAAVCGLIGAGSQARTQLEAVCKVRPIRQVKVFSRTPERRQQFCERMGPRLGLEIAPVASAEEAVRDAQVLITATTARTPVLQGEWLAPGCHVNAMGSNSLARVEIDAATVARCARVVVDSVEQAKLEAGDLVLSIERGTLRWDDVIELRHVVAGHIPGRQADDEITLFDSLGLGLEDVASAAVIYERARERGVGQEIATG